MAEQSSSIFRVQKSTVRVWLDYVGTLHGMFSFRTKRGKQEREPGLLIKHTANVLSKSSMTTIHKEYPQCISELVITAFKSQIMPITLLSLDDTL